MAGKNIVLKNVNKQYENGFHAAKDVNLQICPGEFVILVGPSGCGKSTMLRMIAGLEEISSGELWIDDDLVNFEEPGKRQLSMVFQNYALYPNMNVYKNIAFTLEIRRHSKQEVEQKVLETAKLLGLDKVLDRKPKALSGGQRQRVAIANAIIRNPDILLMDEPLSNLDAKLRGQMRVELAKLHHMLGNTIIYVTHDQTEAMSLGTRIVVMDKGVIQQEDTPENIYKNPVNQFVAGFIGFPPINFFDVDIIKAGENCTLAFAGNRLQCGRALSRRIRGLEDTSTLTAGFRPEAFLDGYAKDCWNEEQMKNGREGCITDGQKFTVTVTHKEFLGSENILYFTIDGKNCCMKASAENPCQIGDEIPVWADMAKLYLFDKKSGRNLFYEGGRRGKSAADTAPPCPIDEKAGEDSWRRLL